MSPSKRSSLSPKQSVAKEKLKEALAGSMSKMNDLFKTWDVDGNGMIDKAEFRQAVSALGLKAADEVCDACFDDYDADGSGEIEYKEYIRYSLRDALKRSASRVMDLFRKWDDDGSGSVDKKEFRRAISSLGFDCPLDVVDSLFDEMDGDGSGSVDFKELNRTLRQGANVKLAAELQVGGAGHITLTSQNKTSLRNSSGARSRSPGRPPSVAVGSPTSHSASPRSTSTASAEPSAGASRVLAARKEFAERQRASKRPSCAGAAAAARTPAPRRSSALPDMLDLGWPVEPEEFYPGYARADGGPSNARPTPRATSVTFAPAFDGGDELQPELQRF